MHHLKWLLAILLFLVSIKKTTGQEVVITRAKLSEDLSVLKLNLETYHTGLYTYTPKATFDHWFEKAASELKDMPAYMFYRKLAELNELIKNGHTFFHINPDQREKDLKMPPFSVYKYKKSFYISDVDDDKHQKLIGMEILTINNVPISEVFETLIRYKKRDGENQTQPKEELLSSFAPTYAIFYGSNNQTKVEVLKEGQSSQIELENVPFQISESKTDSLYENGKVTFKITDDLGILTIPTFNQKQLLKQKYKSLLRQSFAKLESSNVQNLIIDIRNNGGGNTPMVEELISYLYSKPFQFYGDVYQLHKKWDLSIIPAIHHYPQGNANWTLKKGGDGFFRGIVGNDGLKMAKPKKQVYKHNLYLLTNGNTLSAAAEFASFIKYYRPAIFIGEEAGGNKFQNTSGYALQIGLPNSKLIAEIPIILWKMNVEVENDGHGIKPDYWVRNTIENEVQHTDSVLNFAIRHIQNTKKE